MRIKILSMMTVLSILNSCGGYHPRSFWTGKLSDDLGFKEYILSESEKDSIKTINRRGEVLRKATDYYESAAYAFNSKYDDWLNDSINDWVFDYEQFNPMAYFGTKSNGKFTVKKCLSFSGDAFIVKDTLYQDDHIDSLVLMQENAKVVTKDYRKANHKYSSYIPIYGDTALDYYVLPRVIKTNEFAFGGGLKLKYSIKDHSLIDYQQLHDCGIIVKSGIDTDGLLRTSSSGSFYNEVDYYQTFKNSKEFVGQYIILTKVPRVVSYVSVDEKSPIFKFLIDENRQ